MCNSEKYLDCILIHNYYDFQSPVQLPLENTNVITICIYNSFWNHKTCKKWSCYISQQDEESIYILITLQKWNIQKNFYACIIVIRSTNLCFQKTLFSKSENDKQILYPGLNLNVPNIKIIQENICVFQMTW